MFFSFDSLTHHTHLAVFSQVVRFFPKPFANTAAASFCGIFVHASAGNIHRKKFLIQNLPGYANLRKIQNYNNILPVNCIYE